MAFEKDDDLRNALKATVILIAVGVVGYLSLGFIAEKIAFKIPDAWEKKVFSEMKMPSKLGKLESNPPENISAMFSKLINAKGLRDLNYSVNLISMKEPNAFALPGGGVYVTQGLLELVESDMGLAMVLGHELGHHYHRHAMQRVGRGIIFGLASSVIFGGDPGVFLGLAMGVAENSYSHNQEFSADDYGLRIVNEVFKSTDGTLEFYEKIESLSRKTHLTALLSSHPYSGDRKERLQKLAASLRK